MQSGWWAAVVLAVVFVPMLIEAGLAARNERAQRARGGVEPDDDVYWVMRIVYPACFICMIAEGGLRAVPSAAAMAGVATFALAKALKWWAIVSLGPRWTFRVIVVPGAALVGSGPYRFVRHPNYVGVIGELAGVALMTGAIVSGPLVIVVFGALIWKRVAIEERALRLHG